MTDKEIVERAKEAEKRSGFGELVHSPISKGVNSAFGIGFIEGMVEYRNSMQKEPARSNINFEQELYKAFGQVKDFTLGMQIAKRFYDMGKNSKDSQELVSKVWHDASEDPVINSMVIYCCNGCVADIGRFQGVVVTSGKLSWEIYKSSLRKNINNIYKWAYLDELLKL